MLSPLVKKLKHMHNIFINNLILFETYILAILVI